MSHQVKLEKIIQRPANEVFRALKEGRLFMNCSANSSTMKIDFRVGGKYHIDFSSYQKSNFGEFLEIIPDKKLVFSWCQSFEPEQKPDTQVTIELFADGPQTRLVLTHVGFKTKELSDGHETGWTAGITDLFAEIQYGRLRLVRQFAAPVEKLFATCANPQSFFTHMGDVARGSVDFRVGGKYQLPTKKNEIKGEFLEIVTNEKISFSWLTGCTGPLEQSKVTLMFKKADVADSAKLELIHEGLNSEEDQKAHRQGWEAVTEAMYETLGRSTKFNQ